MITEKSVWWPSVERTCQSWGVWEPEGTFCLLPAVVDPWSQH